MTKNPPNFPLPINTSQTPTSCGNNPDEGVATVNTPLSSFFLTSYLSNTHSFSTLQTFFRPCCCSDMITILTTICWTTTPFVQHSTTHYAIILYAFHYPPPCLMPPLSLNMPLFLFSLSPSPNTKDSALCTTSCQPLFHGCSFSRNFDKKHGPDCADAILNRRVML